MFREMRRKNQQLKKEDTLKVIKRCQNGTLACLGDNGYPYSLPLSYVYLDNRIYFHSAKEGHKIDAIKRESRGSFSARDEDRIVSEEYTSYFRSVIAFGKARIVKGDEWVKAFYALVEKYCKDRPEAEKVREINECKASLIIAIDIEHLTGKEAIELVKT